MPRYNPIEEEQDALETCYFMKHQGEKWIDVITEDRDYVVFLTEKYDLKEDLYNYLMDLLEES